MQASQQFLTLPGGMDTNDEGRSGLMGSILRTIVPTSEPITVAMMSVLFSVL